MVNSIGISPPVHETNFEPGKTESYRHNIVNTLDEVITVKVEPSGDLEPYIELKEEEMEIDANGVGTLSYEVNQPEELSPGWHEVEFLIKDKTNRGGGMFSLRLSVIGKLRIFVPYPDIYAEPKMDINDINKGEDIEFEIEIKNRGTEDIVDSNLKLDFFYDDELIEELVYENIDISRLESYTIEERIESNNFNEGLHKAKGTYNYGKEKKFQEPFKIGAFDVDLINYSKKIYTEGVSPVSVTLRNKWNGIIEGTSIHLTINGKTFRSVDETLEAFEEKTYKVYLDKEDLDAGSIYEAQLTIFFGNDEKTKNITLTAVERKNKPTIDEPKDTTTETSIIFNPTIYLIIIAVLLALMNIILLRNKK